MATWPGRLSPHSPAHRSSPVSGGHGVGAGEPRPGGRCPGRAEPKAAGGVGALVAQASGPRPPRPVLLTQPHRGRCAWRLPGATPPGPCSPLPAGPPVSAPLTPATQLCPSGWAAAGRTRSDAPDLLCHQSPGDDTRALPTGRDLGAPQPLSPLWSHTGRQAGSNGPGLHVSEGGHVLGLGPSAPSSQAGPGPILRPSPPTPHPPAASKLAKLCKVPTEEAQCARR